MKIAIDQKNAQNVGDAMRQVSEISAQSGFDEAELAKISARWKAKGTLSRAQFEWLAKYANAFTTALADQTQEPANEAA